MDPVLITALGTIILGVMGAIGGAVKWVVPLLIERGKTRKQTDRRVEFSGSLVEDQADTIGMLERKVVRRDEAILELQRQLAEATHAITP